jgi:hypothetical protein
VYTARVFYSFVRAVVALALRLLGRRAMAVGLAVLLVQGCATVPHEGDSGFSLPVHAAFPGEAWNVFRKEAGDMASPEQVRQMEAITQRHFERWFNKVYDSSQSDALLDRATVAALDDVSALLAR